RRGPPPPLSPARDELRREHGDDVRRLPHDRSRLPDGPGDGVRRRLQLPRGARRRPQDQPEGQRGDRRVRARGHHLPAEQREDLMRLLRRLKSDQQGFALVIALAVTVIFSMTVITIIEAASSTSRGPDRSKGRVSASTLAEAGINTAASILSKSNPFDQHLLHPQGSYQPADCTSPPANPTGQPLLGNTCSPYTWTYDG